MSTKKAATKATTATFDTADRPEKIRNVALVGHSGSGKTTLVEALLAATGTIGRAGTVPDGTTVSDHDPVEVAQQRSVALSVSPLRWDNVVINLLDTPGYPDFTGELRAGLRAADAALFVVSAADEIDPITVSLWEECAALGTPRAVVITKLDVPRAALAPTMASCQRVFGGADGQAVLPLYLRVGGGPGEAPTGLVGLLTGTEYDYSGGFPPKESPDADVDTSADRAALIEAVINNSEDETLLDRYLAGEPIGLDVLIDDLETAVARGTFHPVLPVCSVTGLGLSELLELLCGAFPSPVEMDLPVASHLSGDTVPDLTCDPDGPLLAEVVRTSVDPYLGRLSILRVFSGTLTAESSIHVSGHGGEDRGHPDHDSDERVGQIFSPLGATLRPVDRGIERAIRRIVLLGLAECRDCILVVALGLQCLTEAPIGFRIRELEFSPRAAELRCAMPVPRAQHAGALDADHRDFCAPLGEHGGHVDVDGRGIRGRRLRCIGQPRRCQYGRRTLRHGHSRGQGRRWRPLAADRTAAAGEARGKRAGRGPRIGNRRACPRDRIGHRLVPRNTVQPQHRGESADSRHRIEHARRTMRHEYILGEVPVRFLVLRDLLVGDRNQYGRQQRKAAGDAFPPDAERPLQRTLELRARVPARIRVRDRELQEHAEEPFAGRGSHRGYEQRLDRDP